MKNIRIGCIAFTDDCFKHLDSVEMTLREIFGSLDKNILILIFSSNNNSLVSGSITNLIASNAFKNRIVYCKRSLDETWLISTSFGSIIPLERKLPIEELLKLIQIDHSILKANTITVGATQDQFALKSNSLLHFHVGAKSYLSKKVRGMIPLTEQYETGLQNIVYYFSSVGFKDQAIDYHDLISFIENSRNFYSSQAANKIIQKHRLVTECLANAFSDEIVAIFGSGFPFYLLDAEGCLSSRETPKSILDYFNVQLDYFKRKIISETSFEDDKKRKFTVHELEMINLFPKRNKFDIDNYEKMGYSSPLLEDLGYKELEEYYLSNCFDISDDLWPCYYCSTLQNNDLFPNQIKVKDTNITCLTCQQTSFMLRNIMGCSADLDITVVVKKNKHEVAERIKNFIINKSPYHVYDTKFIETFRENDGPLDLFVTQMSDFLPALSNLLSNNWLSTSFDSIALWSPTIEHNFQLGIDFPLAFEPVFINNVELQEKLFLMRKQFVLKHGIEKILDQLKYASFYTQQLLSNIELIEILERKFQKWQEFIL